MDRREGMMTDEQFAAQGRALVARIQRERAAERVLIAECDRAVKELLASGEPLTERSSTA